MLMDIHQLPATQNPVQHLPVQVEAAVPVVPLLPPQPSYLLHDIIKTSSPGRAQEVFCVFLRPGCPVVRWCDSSGDDRHCVPV